MPPYMNGYFFCAGFNRGIHTPRYERPFRFREKTNFYKKEDLLPYDRSFRRSDVFGNAKKRHKCCAHAASLDGRRVGDFHFCDKKHAFEELTKTFDFATKLVENGH